MSNLISWGEAAEGWAAYQRYRQEHPEKFVGYKTGLRELDRLTGGLQAGTFTIIVGKNKVGKTAAMLSLALPLADQCKVVLLTLEMSPLQLMSRSMANISFTDMNVFRDLRMDDTTWMRIEQAVDCFIQKQGGIAFGLRNIEQIHDLIEKENPDVIIVDYAQLVYSEKMDKSLNSMYSQISHYFKSLTLPTGLKDNKMAELQAVISGQRLRCVITAVQVDKASKRSMQKITDASARDTGAWEDDADYLIAVNEIYTVDGKDVLPDQRELTLSGRYTEGGSFKVKFNRAQARFEDWKDESENVRRVLV